MFDNRHKHAKVRSAIPFCDTKSFPSGPEFLRVVACVANTRIIDSTTTTIAVSRPVKKPIKKIPRRRRFLNRELSWLDFNDRVLEEARDRSVPVLERLRFLAIYASNLDEFFMVRVAFIRRQMEAGIDGPGKDGYRPTEIMRRIVARVREAHEKIGDCYRNMVLPDLEAEGIMLVTDKTVSSEQRTWVDQYYQSTVEPLLSPVIMVTGEPFPRLENGGLYFVVRIRKSGRKKGVLTFLRLPTNALGRFVQLPADQGRTCFMLIDDVIRLCLPKIFPGHRIGGCHEIRIVRDSDLSLDEVGSSDLLKSILEGLKRRQRGPTTRLLFDPAMPPDILRFLKRNLRLKGRHVYPGARYHSFSDFIQLPAMTGRSDLQYHPMPPKTVKELEETASVFEVVSRGDRLLQHPFQSYEHVIRYFEEAADDPAVIAIKATLYRVSSDSRIAAALGRAAENGKQVTVLVELKARFDEERNITWARSLEDSGAQVIYGIKRLKTHCKLALVLRKEEGHVRRYCHLSTGNYNDRTAKIYSDFGLLTSDEKICNDVSLLFNRITADAPVEGYKNLLVAPDFLRDEFARRIRRERKHARKGRPSGIVAKMNSLVDTEMIDELYRASQAGVRVKLIVRGICSLRPGIPGLSENIEVTSIIDRYLEHARIYRFENGGEPEMYLSSADWMPRNLNTRIEVAFPILDASLRSQIETVLNLQLSDTAKARMIQSDGSPVRRTGSKVVRSQYEQYELAGGFV